MQIKINGNMVSIISDIDFAKLDKFANQNPILVKEKGEVVYGAVIAPIGSISPVGVTFTYANADGKASLNVCLTPTFMDAEQTKKYVLDNLSEELQNLQMYEGAVNMALEAASATRDELAETITIG